MKLLRSDVRPRSVRRAFTLLELLIVITIIGILTSILVLNFQGVRERQELALLADKSLALLQQTKAEVGGGKVLIQEDGTSVYLCEGAFFEVGQSVQRVATTYGEEGCDYSALTLETYGVDSGAAVLSGIDFESQSLDSLLVFFTPPDGELVLSDFEGTSLYDEEVRVSFESPTFTPEEGQSQTVLVLSPLSDFAQLILDNPADDEIE